jgi:hypothetical protein
VVLGAVALVEVVVSAMNEPLSITPVPLPLFLKGEGNVDRLTLCRGTNPFAGTASRSRNNKWVDLLVVVTLLERVIVVG